MSLGDLAYRKCKYIADKTLDRMDQTHLTNLLALRLKKKKTDKVQIRLTRDTLGLTRDKQGQTRDSQGQTRDSQGQNRDNQGQVA